LYRLHNIEQQCEETHQREIRLPTGGSIVLDPTEALTAIDINSASATKGKHIDDTALAINLEAAEEIARQLRIRDIGGLIVIDFIDMANRKHGQQVEDLLRKACKGDKARIQFARISRFGLLEMSRQRLHPSVRESTTEGCPRCQGRGSIRTVDSMALQMLTRMEDWSERGKQPTLIVQVPSETGEYLMNNKRANIARIEEAYDIQITLQIRPDLDIPHYRIERQWNENNQQRVEVLEDTGKRIKPPRPNRKLKPVKPVVGIPTPVPEQAPAVEPKKEGPLQSLINLFIGATKKARPKPTETEETSKTEQPNNQRPRRRNRNRGNTQHKKASAATEDNKQQANTKARKPAKKATHKKSEKPKNNPSEDNKAKEQELSSSNNETDTIASKPRRRRRRRRRSAGNSDAANAAQNSDSPDSNNKPQAPSTTTNSEKRDNAPAAKPAPAKADNAPATKPAPAKADNAPAAKPAKVKTDAVTTTAKSAEATE